MYHAPEWYQNLRSISHLLQALGAVLLLMESMPQKNRFWLRVGAVGVVGSIFSYGISQLGSGVYVFCAYLFCILMVRYCTEVSWSMACMIGSMGYMIQHICGNFLMLFRMIPLVGKWIDYSWSIVLLDVIWYSASYYIAWKLCADKMIRDEREATKTQRYMFTILTMVICFAMYSINTFLGRWETTDAIDIAIEELYSVVGGLFLLILELDTIQSRRNERQLFMMESMLQQQEEQFESSKQSAALVNEKYHDLKQLLQTYQGKIDRKVLDELGETLEEYDDKVSTGSQVLDILLTEKRAVCRTQGIQFTCFVNGADFGFMEELELYALVRNILNNAIEATEKIAEREKRFISLTARREDLAIVIHEENPCVSVEFDEDGMPKSQKDPNYHGFGTKSMLRTAEKYNGTMTAEVKDSVYYLDIIMFP